MLAMSLTQRLRVIVATVEVGHILRGIHNANFPLSDIFCTVSDALIYGFHMPLFFFVLGFLFSKYLDKRGTSSFLTDKKRREKFFNAFRVIGGSARQSDEAELNKKRQRHQQIL
jgi:hypothetical protein